MIVELTYCSRKIPPKGFKLYKKWTTPEGIPVRQYRKNIIDEKEIKTYKYLLKELHLSGFKEIIEEN